MTWRRWGETERRYCLVSKGVDESLHVGVVDLVVTPALEGQIPVDVRVAGLHFLPEQREHLQDLGCGIACHQHDQDVEAPDEGGSPEEEGEDEPEDSGDGSSDCPHFVVLFRMKLAASCSETRLD
mgnify:CR=1 FL=1